MKLLLLFTAFIAPLFHCQLIQGQIIQTIAGGGPSNIAATQVGFACSYGGTCGLAIDSGGNVFVSAPSASQIWKIDTSGFVSVFAGNGRYYSDTGVGDGGPALNATLYGPGALAFDNAGNLFVAEDSGKRIRKITTSGIISTVAGTGNRGYLGDGGLAVSASLVGPSSLAINAAGNPFIGDGHILPTVPFGFDDGQRILFVNSGGYISTIAGKATSTISGDGGAATAAGLSYPNGLAIDSNGVVYVGQTCSVRKIAAGIISTIAGTGVCGYSGDGQAATSAQVSPTAIGVDSFNNLYILQPTAIRQISFGQTTISTIAGGQTAGTTGNGGSALAALFNGLAGMGLDKVSNRVYVQSHDGYSRKIAGGLVTVFAGNGSADYTTGDQIATTVPLSSPTLLTVDNLGNLSFTTRGDPYIRKLILSSDTLTTAVGNGVSQYSPDGSSASGPINSVASLSADANGAYTFLETGYLDGSHLRKVSGGTLSTIGVIPVMSGGVYTSTTAANGDFYFANNGGNQVRVWNRQTGLISVVAGNGTSGYSGDGGLAINAAFGDVDALALDGAGNLFIADDTPRIRKVVLSTNVVTTVAGDGTTTITDGLPATSTGTGYLYSLFADDSSNLFFSTNGRIRKITAATGIVSTVAGNGLTAFAGDNGPALSANIDPGSLTIDRSQNLYFSDGSGRIRSTKVNACFFTVGTPTVYTGHLGGSVSVSVTATNSDCPYSVSNTSPFLTITSGSSGTGSGTVTFAVAADSGANRTATIGIGGTSFTVNQAGALEQQNVGYFYPNAPRWVLDSNGSGQYEATDKLFAFGGQPGAIAVTGDWNGDGRTKVGFYLNGFWVLDYNGNGVYDGTGAGGDKFCALGGVGYLPVVGDWNGDGKTKIGFYKDGFWALDTNGNCQWDGPAGGDSFIGLGGAGYTPLVGDWNGNGKTKVGYYYQGKWALDYDGDGAFTAADKYYPSFVYAAGDKPVVGDWTGDGKTKIGVYRNGFWILDANNNGTYDGVGAGMDKFYGLGGNVGEVPFVGDWNGSGTSKIGVFVNGFWVLDYNGNGSWDGAATDRFVAFGDPTVQPIVGRW